MISSAKINTNEVIFLSGHKGLLGKSLHKILLKKGYKNIITKDKSELDLTIQHDVDNFFKKNKIDQVFLSAAKVGGILANIKYPKDFIYENLMIQTNIINASNNNDIEKLLFFGSSCIYPSNSLIPIKEDALLMGRPEITNEFYAIAKIAGLKLCESINIQFERDYKTIMPCNLYGPGDNFTKNYNHVLPALLLKFHEAARLNSNSVEIWGTGKPLREFLFVDDLAEAAIILINTPTNHKIANYYNVGSGEEISIENLAKLISSITNFKGNLTFNSKKPSGVYRKLLDSSLIKKLGWSPSTNLNLGIKKTYDWLIEQS